jgi:hypothetical protein
LPANTKEEGAQSGIANEKLNENYPVLPSSGNVKIEVLLNMTVFFPS